MRLYFRPGGAPGLFTLALPPLTSAEALVFLGFLLRTCRPRLPGKA